MGSGRHLMRPGGIRPRWIRFRLLAGSLAMFLVQMMGGGVGAAAAPSTWPVLPSPSASPGVTARPSPSAVPAAAAPAPRPRIALLIVDPQGVWDRDVQEQWEALNARSDKTVSWLSWQQVLDGPAAAGLSADDKAQLLHYPDLPLMGQRRAELTRVPYVVVAAARRKTAGPLTAVLLETGSGHQTRLARCTETNRARALAKLEEEVARVVVRVSTPVWGYVPGKQYHVVGCDHVHTEQVVIIASEAQAQRDGYEACRVCFPQSGGNGGRASQEVALGREIAGYILQRYREDDDRVRQARVQRVGRRLVEANGLTSFEYSFRALKTDECNAFAVGGGLIFITQGMERITAGNDDMLATVLGHEIGHTEKHHVIRQYNQAQTYGLLGAIISVATHTYLGGFLSDFASGLIMRGHGRAFEAEADRCGVMYAYGAGYRPEDFELVIKALKKLSEGKPQGPGWLRTHPTEDDRLQMTRLAVSEVHKLDEVVAAYERVDPGVAARIRGQAEDMVARRTPLLQALPVWKRCLGDLPAQPPAAETVPDRVHAEGDLDSR